MGDRERTIEDGEALTGLKMENRVGQGSETWVGRGPGTQSEEGLEEREIRAGGRKEEEAEGMTQEK